MHGWRALWKLLPGAADRLCEDHADAPASAVGRSGWRGVHPGAMPGVWWGSAAARTGAESEKAAAGLPRLQPLRTDRVHGGSVVGSSSGEQRACFVFVSGDSAGATAGEPEGVRIG